jgi:ubiquinone/menaquinone biosynthesis C-methylase UbiE
MEMKLQMTHHQELSVTDLFIEYFEKHFNSIDIELDEEISLCNNIKTLCLQHGESFIEKCNHALRYAYDTKYGNWDDVNDLRKLYGSDWCTPIKKYFENVTQSNTLIDIGCNDGRELKDITGGNFSKPKITLIDISRKAINRLQQSVEHRHIEVINGSFNTVRFKKNSFDFCVSLRTLHSSGIDTNESLKRCYEITKPKGIIILSVSNGYIDDITGEPLKGMYNYSTGMVDEEKPFQVAKDMADKLISFNAVNVNIIEGNAEIFIIGYKNEKQ